MTQAIRAVGRNHFPLTLAKQPARGARGVVCTNHPLASAAGAGVLAEGGNAVDAAIAALFALSVVEPMMVGITGGGVAHLRLADGRHEIIDGLGTAPAAATPNMYRPIPGSPPEERAVEGRANEVGALAVAVPGALPAWTSALERHGTWSLADVMAPAIRLAERGFRATPYLSDCASDHVAHLARDATLSALFLRDGRAIPAGERVTQPEFAETLRSIARDGIGVLHGGAIGRLMAEALARAGGIMALSDLANAAPKLREPVRGTYRGYEVLAPPPPSSSGVHIAQMLNVLEGFDLAALGFGTVAAVHLLAETMKLAFADRAVGTADPDFVTAPVAALLSKDYAAARRALIDMSRAKAWEPGVAPVEGDCTTHLTVADAAGNIVASTQTLNGLFGAKIAVPGTGMICNNYMYNFDPHPGRALSVAPGKRVFTSMAPTIVLRDGRPRYALGQPGGLKIFTSTMQAMLNLFDHGMSLQEAFEAPRVWTMGNALEIEPAVPDDVAERLGAMGHDVKRARTIGGGINGIAFHDDGMMEGAACWRGDGSVVALGGGLARAGIRFGI
jgi:gamma-glutamyltranspeptidase/glutathione hydrolase